MMTLASKAIFSTVWIDMLKQRGAYVGDCLSVSRCSDFELKSADGIWLEILITKSTNILFLHSVVSAGWLKIHQP